MGTKWIVVELRIFHHYDERGGVHTFWTNKMKYTREDVRNAPFERTDRTPRKVRKIGRKEYVPGDMEVLVRNDGSLTAFFYPYASIDCAGGTLKKLPKGGQGIGTVFARRVYERLLQHYEPETVFHRAYPVSDDFKARLRKAGLDWKVDDYTLQQHADAFREMERRQDREHGHPSVKTTVMEDHYQKEVLQKYNILTRSLPHALAIMANHNHLHDATALLTLERHAEEIVRRDHVRNPYEELVKQFAEEKSRAENQNLKKRKWAYPENG